MITNSYAAPDTLEPAHTWRVRARCRSLTPADAEIFFSPYRGDIEYAKSICRRCPVMQQCRDDALDRNEPWGVWGALDRNDRLEAKEEAA